MKKQASLEATVKFFIVRDERGLATDEMIIHVHSEQGHPLAEDATDYFEQVHTDMVIERLRDILPCATSTEV